MIEIYIKIAKVGDETLSNKTAQYSPNITLGEIMAAVFEIERLKQELIIKSYGIKPIAEFHGTVPPNKSP